MLPAKHAFSGLNAVVTSLIKLSLQTIPNIEKCPEFLRLTLLLLHHLHEYCNTFRGHLKISRMPGFFDELTPRNMLSLSVFGRDYRLHSLGITLSLHDT